MKCIVTAGPTYEELDDVRRLTNFSTGTLGTELANSLMQNGHEVILLRGYYSISRIEPLTPQTHTFTTTADLAARLKKLRSSGAGAVFHAAAVSDFTFGKIWRHTAEGKLLPVRSRKISSRTGTLLAELIPTPKIISSLRPWFPRARLVGWKYEVDGGRARIVNLGQRQVEENRTDACVVNGGAYGRGFGFVTDSESVQHLANKKALFAALANFLKD